MGDQPNGHLVELLEGMGTINWWGLSPALDLLPPDAADASGADGEGSADLERVDILLAGGGDIRHILKTMAMSKRKKPKQVHFWVMEPLIELLARQMLQLSLALEPSTTVGEQEKVEMFLELLGNAHIRSKTSEYLIAKATTLVDLITDPDDMETRFPLVDLSALKFKERDALTAVCQFWRVPSPALFNMGELWLYRLRIYLKQRFDSRRNVADWDYSMKVKDIAPIIHNRQFIAWRDNGLAFNMRDAPYDVDNRTLASGRVMKGAGKWEPSVEKRGYWGDIVASPYIAFGTESENKKLFKQSNSQNTRSAVDVSQFNCAAYFHEIATGQRYEGGVETQNDELNPDSGPAAQAAQAGAAKAEEGKIVEIDEADEGVAPDPPVAPAGEAGEAAASGEAGEAAASGEAAAAKEEVKPAATKSRSRRKKTKDTSCIHIAMPNYKVHFMPMTATTDINTKSKYKGRFNAAYFNASMAQHLKPETAQIFAPNALITIEAALYVIGLKEEQKGEFLQRVTKIAAEVDAKPVGTLDATTDSHFTYLRQGPKTWGDAN